MGLFDKKSTFRKFIDSITNAIYDNPDLGPEFMEELEESLVLGLGRLEDIAPHLPAPGADTAGPAASGTGDLEAHTA